MPEYNIRVEVDPSGVEGGAGRVSTALMGVGGTARALQAQLMKTFALVGVSVGIGASIRLLSRFSETMAEVKAVSKGTSADFEMMKDRAMELGSKTHFGATQAAQALVVYQKAGFDAAESSRLIGTTTNLATAGHIGLANAAMLTSKILKGYKMPISEAARVTDLLTSASTYSNQSMGSMAAALKMSAAIASGYNVKMETTVAALTALAEAGYEGRGAGMALRKVIEGLEHPSDKAKAAIESLGLSVNDVKVSTVGLAPALKKLVDAGIDMPTAAEIFSGKGVIGFEYLSEGIDTVTELEERFKSAGGEAERIAGIMEDNLGSAMEEVKTAFEGVILAVGDLGAEEGLTRFFEILRSALLFVIAHIQTFTRILTIAATVLVGVFVQKGINAAIGGLGRLWELLATNPWDAVRMGILGVITTLVIFSDKLKISADGVVTLQDFFKGAVQVINEALDSLGKEDLVGPIQKQTQAGASNIALMFLSILKAAAMVLDKLVGFVVAIVGAIVAAFAGLPNLIGGIWIKVHNKTIDVYQKTFNTIIGWINKLRGAMGLGLLEGISDEEAALQKMQEVATGGFYKLGTTIRDVFIEGMSQWTLTSAVDKMITSAEDIAFQRLRETHVPPGAATPKPEITEPEKEHKPITKAKLTDFDLYLKQLEQERDLLGLSNDERFIREGLLQAEQTLERSLQPFEEKKLTNLLTEIQLLQTKAEVLDQIKGPQEDLIRQTNALNQLYKDGKISVEEYNVALDNARLAALQMGIDMDSGISRGLIQIKESIINVGAAAENTLVNAFRNAEDALVSFVTTGEVNFKAFVDSILADLTRLMLRQAIMGLFGGALMPAPSGGGGGGGIVGAGVGSHFQLGGFQTGGSFRVGGSGGPDSQLVAFKATPGESVDVSRPGQQPNVNVAAPEVKVRVVNTMDPHTALDALGSAKGEQIIMNVIRQNPNTIRRLLGG